VTGGASAAYGSDAIAGVVNFIMKKNFEGIQVDSQYNENYHDNGNTTRRTWFSSLATHRRPARSRTDARVTSIS